MSQTDESKTNDVIPRACGLLVIEVENSNPNGDPDRDSDPRQRPDGLGEISPVSFKRKPRRTSWIPSRRTGRTEKASPGVP